MPTKVPAVYAKRALDVLQTIGEVAPQTLPIFLAANSVLTISGVRTYDAYREFYDFYNGREKAAVTSVLDNQGITMLFTDQKLRKSSFNDTSFELINNHGLTAVWETYRLPNVDYWPPDIKLDKAYDEAHFLAWSYIVEGALANMMDNDTLPKVWLTDRYAAHNIRFGMLLGYPAKAIESFLWTSSAVIEANSITGVKALQARIRHHDAYYAAWPDYDYAAVLIDDPEVIAHEELWSLILDEVYASEWHAGIQADKCFAEALEKVRACETGQTVGMTN